MAGRSNPPPDGVCVCVQITKCGRIKTLLLLVHLRASQLFNTPPLRTPV